MLRQAQHENGCNEATGKCNEAGGYPPCDPTTDTQTCTQTGTQDAYGMCDFGAGYSEGRYSKFGERGYYWSSSTLSDGSDYVWFVDFFDRYVDNCYKGEDSYVRCVR